MIDGSASTELITTELLPRPVVRLVCAGLGNCLLHCEDDFAQPVLANQSVNMNDESDNQNEPKEIWYKVRLPSGPQYLVAVLSKCEKGEKTDFPQNRAVEAINTVLGAEIGTTDLHPYEESQKAVADLTPVESKRDDVKLWKF